MSLTGPRSANTAKAEAPGPTSAGTFDAGPAQSAPDLHAMVPFTNQEPWGVHAAHHRHQQAQQQQVKKLERWLAAGTPHEGGPPEPKRSRTADDGPGMRLMPTGIAPQPQERSSAYSMPNQLGHWPAEQRRMPPWVGAPGSSSRLQGAPVASGPPPGTKPWQGTSASAGRARHAVDTYNNQSWPPSEAEGQAADWSSPTPYVSHVDVNRRGMAPGRPGTQMGVPQGAPWTRRPPVARPHASRHVMRVPRRPPPRPAHYGYYAHRPASFKQMGYHHGPTRPRPVHYHGYTGPAAVPADWYDYTADPELQYCDCPACQSQMDHDYYDGADDYSDVVHNVGVPLRHRYYTHSAPPPPTWVDGPHPRSHVSPHLLRPVHSSTHSCGGNFEDPAWVDMHEPSHTPVMPREQGAADYMPRLQTTRPWDAPPQTGGQPPADVYAAPHIGTSPTSFRSRQFARHESSESSYPTAPVWSHHVRGHGVIAAADMHDAHRDFAATGKPADNWGPTEAADDCSWGQGQQQTHPTDTAAVPLMNGTGEGVSGDNGMPGARQPPGQDARHSMEQHAVYGSDTAYETGHGGSQNLPMGNGHDSQVYQGGYADHDSAQAAQDGRHSAGQDATVHRGSHFASNQQHAGWSQPAAHATRMQTWQERESSNGSQTVLDNGHGDYPVAANTGHEIHNGHGGHGSPRGGQFADLHSHGLHEQLQHQSDQLGRAQHGSQYQRSMPAPAHTQAAAIGEAGHTGTTGAFCPSATGGFGNGSNEVSCDEFQQQPDTRAPETPGQPAPPFAALNTPVAPAKQHGAAPGWTASQPALPDAIANALDAVCAKNPAAPAAVLAAELQKLFPTMPPAVAQLLLSMHASHKQKGDQGKASKSVVSCMHTVRSDPAAEEVTSAACHSGGQGPANQSLSTAAHTEPSLNAMISKDNVLQSASSQDRLTEPQSLQTVVVPRDILYAWVAAGTLPVNAPGFLIRTLGPGCWEALLGHANPASPQDDLEVWYECAQIQSVAVTPGQAGAKPTYTLVVRAAGATDGRRTVLLEEVSNEVPTVSEVSHWLHSGGSISSEEASMLRSRLAVSNQ